MVCFRRYLITLPYLTLLFMQLSLKVEPSAYRSADMKAEFDMKYLLKVIQSVCTPITSRHGIAYRHMIMPASFLVSADSWACDTPISIFWRPGSFNKRVPNSLLTTDINHKICCSFLFHSVVIHLKQ